jgi:glutamate-5-semialdehyde dehydrogenase
MSYNIEKQLQQARKGSKLLALASTEQKNRALGLIARRLENRSDEILRANRKDVAGAAKLGLSSALTDRLTLTKKRIMGIAADTRGIMRLPDPVGEILEERRLANGCLLRKIRVPIGVICVIYESRPNVTVDSAALCLKSGNAVILRGGRETLNSNLVLAGIISDAVKEAGLPEGIVQFVGTPERGVIYEILAADKPAVDMAILRGSEEMIGDVRKKATVPIIAHGKGLCHTYVDRSADIGMAVKIAYNAKVQRPGVCNAMETLLVHKDIAARLLPVLAKKYIEAGVELRGCRRTMKLLRGIKPATEKDWSTEYLDLTLSIKIVDTEDEAINHIARYGSGHSEAVIAGDKEAAEKFLREVDASAVFHNASTRLHDGAVFGLGAELGISTGKLHARGSMGLRELTTTKYIIHGKGQIRE